MRDQAAGGPLVRFEAVSKGFGGVTAVDRLSLDIHEGEFFALLGPSGCGKTTLLRLLAGFERPDAGRILLDGIDLGPVQPHRRPVNMMFQSYALFPHLTVAGNVAFGLRQDRLPRGKIEARVGEMLALVKLDGLGARKPEQLSGGQRQRVALARALAKRPRVLLLDEPLAALDKKLREETQFELMSLREKLGLTFVIVTHDQEEAMTVSDRIAVMNHGRLAQVGAPMAVYEHPNSRWVADFIGDVNLIEGRIVARDPQGIRISSSVAGELRAGASDAMLGSMVCLAVRPEKLRVVCACPEARGDNSLAGVVTTIGYLGDLSIYKIRLDSGFVVKASVVNLTRGPGQTIGEGDRVWVVFSPDAGVVLTS